MKNYKKGMKLSLRILWLAPIENDFSSNLDRSPWISTLARELAHSKNIKLTILNYSSRITKNVLEYTKDGMKYIFLKTPSYKLDLFSLFSLRIGIVKQFLRENINNYDLVHIHGTEHQYECMIKSLQIPSIISIQGIISECFKSYHRYNKIDSLRWLIASAYEINGFHNKNNYFYRTGWDKDIVSKYNQNSEFYKCWELVRPEFYNNKYNYKKCNLVFMGGFSEFKGIIESILAFRQVKKYFKRCELIIIGSCDFKRFKNLLKKYNMSHISQNIKCYGFLDARNIVKIFQDCYCLLHPSYIDNSPNSVCEAQVFGLPVIATRVGGLESLITDNNTGILCKKKDPEGLANKILFLLNNPKLAREISENSKNIASKRHSKTKIVEKTIQTYFDLTR